jgi:hypothetical protein
MRRTARKSKSVRRINRVATEETGDAILHSHSLGDVSATRGEPRRGGRLQVARREASSNQMRASVACAIARFNAPTEDERSAAAPSGVLVRHQFSNLCDRLRHAREEFRTNFYVAIWLHKLCLRKVKKIDSASGPC